MMRIDLIDVIRSLINVPQKEGKELSSYKTRFRNLSDITTAQLGREIILQKSEMDCCYLLWGRNMDSRKINILQH